MLGLFSVIKDKIKPKVTGETIDNWIFRLHYRVTTVIFLVATILVCSREYIGEHIKCINDMRDDGFTKVVETFCFFTSTFTVVEDNPHPNVPLGLGNAKTVRRHTYYQWVPFVLFIQAILFYLPHILWKKFENNTIKKLVVGLNNSSLALLDKTIKVEDVDIPTRENYIKNVRDLKKAFLDTISHNKFWAWCMIFCEVINLLHVILEFYATDKFLGGQFFLLGPNLITNGTSTLDHVFPKMTKCTFHKYGAGGSIQLHDALCVLALNVVNEKIYVFLWFWFVVLLGASCVALMWRGLCMVLFSTIGFNQIIFGSASKGRLYPWQINMVVKHCKFPDWMLLTYLSKNLSSLTFRELFLNIFEDLEEKKPLLKNIGFVYGPKDE